MINHLLKLIKTLVVLQVPLTTDPSLLPLNQKSLPDCLEVVKKKKLFILGVGLEELTLVAHSPREMKNWSSSPCLPGECKKGLQRCLLERGAGGQDNTILNENSLLTALVGNCCVSGLRIGVSQTVLEPLRGPLRWCPNSPCQMCTYVSDLQDGAPWWLTP